MTKEIVQFVDKKIVQFVDQNNLSDKKITGFRGNISWDTSKPDGTPKKLLDISLLNKLGFKSLFSLEEGINSVYKHYIDNL